MEKALSGEVFGLEDFGDIDPKVTVDSMDKLIAFGLVARADA